jgi:hypothetical protein
MIILHIAVALSSLLGKKTIGIKLEELNRKDPSWLNAPLLVAISLVLSLALVVAYKGWKEDRALHPSEHEGSLQTHVSCLSRIDL